MLRQLRTTTMSGDEAAPFNSPYRTDAEFKRALAAAVGAQRAGLGDEPVYSTGHGIAKVGTAGLDGLLAYSAVYDCSGSA